MKFNKLPFHKALTSPNFWPEARIKTQWMESSNYWIYKTGDWVYKVKKHLDPHSSIDMDGIFCQEVQTRLGQYSPYLENTTLTLLPEGDSWRLSDGLAEVGDRGYYILKQRQLADRGFASSYLEKDKLKPEHVKPIAQWLAKMHEQAAIGDNKELAKESFFKGLLDADLYQAKKFLGKPLTQSQIELTLRPFEKRCHEVKKLLGQRLRSDKVKKVHGCFRPGKIHVTGKEVHVLALSGDPFQLPMRDLASDLADFTVALRSRERVELAELFTATYVKETGDQDILEILPIFELLKALSRGLHYSMAAQGEENPEAMNKAKAYYALMVERARSL